MEDQFGPSIFLGRGNVGSLEASDRNSIHHELIVPPKDGGHEQECRLHYVLLRRTLLVLRRRRRRLRPVRPEQALEQLLPLLPHEPLPHELLPLLKHSRVSHRQRLVPAQQLPLLDVEAGLVGVQLHVAASSAELERHWRVEPESLVDDGLHQLHVSGCLEAQFFGLSRFGDESGLEWGGESGDGGEELGEEDGEAAECVEAENEYEIVDGLALGQAIFLHSSRNLLDIFNS